MNSEKTETELLDTLKLVKQVMDSDDYSIDFDDLYDRIAAVIAKYEN